LLLKHGLIITIVLAKGTVKMLHKRSLIALATASTLLTLSCAPALALDKALAAAVDGNWRSTESKARDQYRHPAKSLSFWGLKPGMSVVEIEPGAKGWWVEILAPYAKATGGSYAAALFDAGQEGLPPGTKDFMSKANAAFATEVADKTIFGETKAYEFGINRLNDIPAGSADMVLVARAFHNWSRSGRTEPYLKAFYTILKPGGILAVEQHRAPEGHGFKPETGYVPESYVIEEAKTAGFILVAKSEINANAKDSRDHPFGVWTLKPIRRSSDASRTLTTEERATFDAIGESDRMTLRFKKP
jgi:predicted methyltransferase